MPPLHPLLLGFLVALGVGLLIGIDRERRKGEGPARQAAGLRTFTLASLAGAIAMAAGGALLLAATAVGVAAFAGLSYWRSRDSDPGLTTELALVLTARLGGLAILEPTFAAALGVVVAILLAARSYLHRFVQSVLTNEEIESVLIFAGATLVVLPLLPDHPIGPYGALNLRTIWIVVILVMAVSALGYVAVRLVGARYGLPLAGLASGFVSSSATIGTMGARAAKDPELMKPAVAGAVLSSVATVVELAILIGTISMEALDTLSLPLVLSGAAAIVYGGAFTLWALKHSAKDDEAATGKAFSLRAALTFAAILAVVLLAAATAGFADAHSAAISVASLVGDKRITAPLSVVPILAALTTNTIAKAGFAIGAGGSTFALYVIPGLVLMIAAAWAGAFVTGSVRF